MPQRKHYTASEKLAIQFVLTQLRNRSSEWPDANWCNFVWFDDIVSEDLDTLGVIPSELTMERTRRVIKFYLGTDLVVELTLSGQRSIGAVEGKRFSAWAVTEVRYETDWKTGHVSTLIDRSIIGNMSGSYEEE